MIDTLTLRLDYVDFDLTGLDIKSIKNESGTVDKTSWKIKNLTVTIDNLSKKTYIQGSLKKFYYGDGALEDFSFNDLMIAIRLLQEALKLPPDKIKKFYDVDILRMDMGMNIETTKPVSEYINAIQSRPRAEKDKFSDESVQFETSAKKIILYNKYKERRTKGSLKPEQITFKGNAVDHDRWLRFEVQWKKVSGLKEQLYGTRKLIQIFDNYSRLLDRLNDEFNKLAFSGNSNIDVIKPIDNSADALAAALVISAKGDTSAIELINDLLAKGLIGKNRAAYCRKKIRGSIEFFKEAEHNQKDELLNEIKDRLEANYYFYQYDRLKQSAGERRKLMLEATKKMKADLGKPFVVDPGNLSL